MEATASDCSGKGGQSWMLVESGIGQNRPLDFGLRHGANRGWKISDARTVYNFDTIDVDGKPEVHFKYLKKLVGERGFEPPTPWSRTMELQTPSALSGVA